MTREKRRASGETWIAFVLVAFGVLMFGAGVYGIVSGSRIVQVEAGWTSVIAGSVLLVGGVLTTALAFVLRTLNQVKSGLQAEGQWRSSLQMHSSPPVAVHADGPQAPIFGTPAEVPTVAQEATTGPTLASANDTIQVETPALAAATASNDAAALVDEPIDTGPAVVDRSPVRMPPSRPTQLASTPSVLRPSSRPSLFRRKATTPAPEDAAADFPAATDPLASSRTQDGTPVEPEHTPVVEDAGASISHEADPAEAAHPADDFKVDRSHELPTAPRSQVPALSAVQSVDEGWLDRALADIEEATPKLEREHAPVADSHSFAEAPAQDFEQQDFEHQDFDRQDFDRQDFEAAQVEPESAYVDQDPAPTLPPAPTLRPTTTAAVIGRYEADGTSYVMYADGSIEAHSEMGVYRFASMTELKAFMEA